MFSFTKKGYIDDNSPLTPASREKDQLKGFAVTNDCRVRPRMCPWKYPRKTKILLILETDGGIIFYG